MTEEEELVVFAEDDCAADEELDCIFSLEDDVRLSDGVGKFSTSWDSYFTTVSSSAQAENTTAKDATAAIFTNALFPNKLRPIINPLRCFLNI